MGFMRRLKEWRSQYIIDQVHGVDLPEFKDQESKRYRITFRGRVQNVGFRYEVYQMAKRLGLTGYCKNLDNGDVLSELQGPQDRIDFLISFMESLKRIVIDEKIIEVIDLDPKETNFQII